MIDQQMVLELEKKLDNVLFFKSKSSMLWNYVYDKDLLGKGNYGYVMCGFRRSDRLSVAIKVIPNNLIDNWYFYQNKKIKIPMEVLLLVHASEIDGVINIIEYGFDKDANEWYIIMERCTKAQDLFEYICSMGYLNEVLACQIFKQLLRIVIECHLNGILHQDLKEENILIDTTGSSKKIWLIDFGSGSLMTNDYINKYTGTFEYSSPEWIKNHQFKGCQMESWCLGVLLYAMVCGCVPFEEKQQILRSPSTLHFPRRDISLECKDLIRKCLDREPETRIQPVEIMLHPWLKYATRASDILQKNPNGNAVVCTGCDSGRASFDEAFISRKNSANLSQLNQERQDRSNSKSHISNCYCNCVSAALIIGTHNCEDYTPLAKKISVGSMSNAALQLSTNNSSSMLLSNNNNSSSDVAAIELVNYNIDESTIRENHWDFRVISCSASPESRADRTILTAKFNLDSPTRTGLTYDDIYQSTHTSYMMSPTHQINKECHHSSSNHNQDEEEDIQFHLDIMDGNIEPIDVQ